MAVYRESPKCPFCGRATAVQVHKDQSKIPLFQQMIGDTFIRWEYKKCNCEQSIAEEIRLSEERKAFLDAYTETYPIPLENSMDEFSRRIYFSLVLKNKQNKQTDDTKR